jgi:GAF domain-containing protein
MENARLLTETRESLEQQTATAEVLQVINSSPGDLGPVFDSILEKAHTLCGAEFGSLFLYDGEHFRAIASHGVPEELASRLREGIGAKDSRGSQQLIAGAPFAHIHDSALEEHAVYLGMIVAGRLEVRPFTDKQIALLQNFAAQAVIAMENARLLTETREALEQQTATGEVLQVINSYTGDLTPVFDAILEKAHNLCGAAHGVMVIREGEGFRTVAANGVEPAFVEAMRQLGPIRPPDGSGPARLILGEQIVHIADYQAASFLENAPPQLRRVAEIGGIRTVVMVPLRKDDAVIGIITAFRQEVRPFSEKQIALLQNFAAQAVIAMENARLLTETREVLEQQTATAEILREISGSPIDVQPTFDAIAAAAVTLTNAAMAGVVRYDGRLMHLAAMSGVTPEDDEVIRGLFPMQADTGTATGRAVLTRQVIHVEDLAVDPERGYPTLDQSSGPTVLAVPMLRDGLPIGAIKVQRRHVEPFTDKQIDLFKTFADQAVIAVENVRLFNETKEALEQQTATAEVLQVINSSPGDLAPVFDAILEKAGRLCETAFGILWTYDGERFHAAAINAPPFADKAILQPQTPEPGGVLARHIAGENRIHIADLAGDRALYEVHPRRRFLVDDLGMRTTLSVALRKDGDLLGAIGVYRQEVRLFTDKQIALLENFATQAVIAMESARLINETREALEQQTATAEVLQVINSSPGDLAPVFDAILEKAHTLCGADNGSLLMYDGELFWPAAWHGASIRLIEGKPEAIDPNVAESFGRIVRGAHLEHIPDMATFATRISDATTRQRLGTLVESGGIRTQLVVALRKDERLLGAITANRKEVRPFSDKQVSLLQNFAAQAVIAMENARLLTETREALEQQTATAEVLQVINSSPGDVAPVFDAILEKAHTLCGAALGGLVLFDGVEFRPVAVRADPVFAEHWRRTPVQASGDAPLARLLNGALFVHVADVQSEDAYRDIPIYRDLMDRVRIRTLLIVPLRKDGALLGAISAFRQEVRPFTDKQIALLENFAAQAVIAMENARLITETREALEQQTATAEVLQVINSSPGDLAPVFDAMLDKALDLCGAAFGTLWTRDGEFFSAAALRRVPAAYAEFLAQGPVRATPGLSSGLGSLLDGKGFFHLLDAASEPAYQGDNLGAHALIELGGARTYCRCAIAQGRRFGRRYHDLSSGGPPVCRQADCAAAEFCGAGGHRDRERAFVDRDARGAGAADCDRRGIRGHQLFARRPSAGLRRHTGEGDAAL